METPRKVKCEMVVASSENFDIVTFPGRVVAATDVNLGFRIAGIIEEICVKDGAFVQSGEVVARLDKRDYEIQLAATEAEYSAIKSEVDRIVSLYEDESVSANDYDKAVNGLKAISAKLLAHQNALADTELRAPFDGYIQKNNFDRGEAVGAGTPVISMISATAPEITINIPTAHYLKQSKFDSATATIEHYGENIFTLQLKGISPKANLNQLYKATFIVDSDNELLPAAGMTAMVEMRYHIEGDNLVTIPFKAIVERDSQSYVWVVKDSKVESRGITIANINSDGTTEISSGVSAGDVIVTAGVNSLEEGQQVEVLKAVSTSNIGGLM
ncbi:MAG: efflux RND transporter periplasmic adaptor subunit [Rikenellaceae bacterium]